MSHYDNQGRRVLSGNPSTGEDEAKALRVENERLRAAHLSIVETTEGLPGAVIQECRQIARAALQEGKT